MRQPQKSSGPFYGWYIVAALFFSTFIVIGVRQGFGVFVLAWEEDFGATTTAISAAAAIGWVVNGVSQPFLGALTDRVGARRVLIFGMLAMGLSTLLVAASTNPIMLAATYGFLVSFASGALSFTPSGALLARWFVRRRGMAMSLLTVGGSASGIIMIPFLAYFLLSTSWQTVWLVLGSMILVLGLPVLIFIVRSRPEDIGLLPDGDIEDAPEPQPAGAAGPVRHARRIAAVGPLATDRWQSSFRSAPMWQLSMAYWVCGITTASISVHFVRWASSEDISSSTAALAFGLLSGINALGVLFVGSISDKMQRKTLLGLVYMVRGMAFLCLVFLPGATALWAFAIVGGMSWLATVPLTTSLAADVYGVKKLGTLAGLINMAHQLGGGAAVLVFGWVFDSTGTYDAAFAGGAALLLMAGIVSLTIREKRYSARYQPSLPHASVAVPVSAGAAASDGD
ncbi:MAG: MFS transporter [Chloroflexi bacterium]|nr:MFS transporter [Chloroflexota bacterium]MDA1298234.1 MFS transporter [Chloroflexota bacterium]